MSALACPYCNRALYFSSETGMWYCYRCRQYYPYSTPEAYPLAPYYAPPYYQLPVQPIVLRSEPSGVAIAAFILFVIIIILLLGGIYFYWRMFYL